MQLLIVLALVFASFVAIFALQNGETVPIRFFAWERETSVAVIVLATAAVGAVSAVLAGLVRELRREIRFRHLRAELSKVQRLFDEERARAAELERRLAEAGASHERTLSPDQPEAPGAGAGDEPER